MIVLAKFIGENGSMGYIKNKQYLLRVSNDNTITRLDGTGKCQYESVVAFLNNWSNIVKHIHS
jgi:hypothetical protein